MTAPARLVLVDQPGEPLRLITYQPDVQPVAVEVTPARALALAADLLEEADLVGRAAERDGGARPSERLTAARGRSGRKSSHKPQGVPTP